VRAGVGGCGWGFGFYLGVYGTIPAALAGFVEGMALRVARGSRVPRLTE
jgi:hypothetical protein